MTKTIRTPSQAWALLFSELGGALNAAFSSQGRSVLRQSVRDYGAARGRSRQQELLAGGHNVNILTLFTADSDVLEDPGLRAELLRMEPEELCLNVADCPMAAVWDAQGCSEIGAIYCEEFYPALVKAAFFEKAQVNVTQQLTHDRDSLCRFGFYTRQANLSAQERQSCFHPDRSDAPIPPSRSAEELLRRQWLLFFLCCHKNTDEKLGGAGLTVLAAALERLAERLNAQADDAIIETIAAWPCCAGAHVCGGEASADAQALYDRHFRSFWVQKTTGEKEESH